MTRPSPTVRKALNDKVIKLVYKKRVLDTEHYFLLCHAYDVFRHDPLSSVNPILLLYDIICPSNEELINVILLSTQQDNFLEYLARLCVHYMIRKYGHISSCSCYVTAHCIDS